MAKNWKASTAFDDEQFASAVNNIQRTIFTQGTLFKELFASIIKFFFFLFFILNYKVTKGNIRKYHSRSIKDQEQTCRSNRVFQQGNSKRK